jgi:hypothetical protein
VDEDLLGRFRLVVVVGSFHELVVDERRAAADEGATRCGPLTVHHRSCAASISLNAIASPAAREPGPRMIFVRCQTVAKVDPDRVRDAQMDPVLGQEVVERQQDLEVVGDLRGRFGELRTVSGPERCGGVEGMAVLGVPDLGQRLLRPRDALTRPSARSSALPSRPQRSYMQLHLSANSVEKRQRRAFPWGSSSGG